MLNILCSHKTLSLDNSSKKNENQKIFFISNSKLVGLFNDTTHISHNEYTDLLKLSEKRKLFENIVPPPTSGVGTKTCAVLLLVVFLYST